jgi:hypothetical protein
MPLHILGIRHHGPGSSKHILKALESIKPNILLIEGPPEGEEMLKWANNKDMKPPVALLAYQTENPQNAVFYPFTQFSPEWNAIQYGLANQIPIWQIDMPLVHKMALKEEMKKELDDALSKNEPHIEENSEKGENEEEFQMPIRKNPIAYLAEIAGFEDAEEWWEQQFEIVQQPLEVFDAIAEAMTALREQLPAENDRIEQIREAFMRRYIRKAQKELFSNIVVICGAWHVPALLNMPKQKDDDEILKNLPKTKVEMCWIPWTYERMSFESGYGAGVASPGWYHHCWHHPEDDGTVWLSRTAHIFRNHKVDISSAHIIEAVRLSNSLSSLRNLQRAGLKELNEATQTVMCMGDDVQMNIIWKELIVGKSLGDIPDGTPQAPLQVDFQAQAKKLRLKFETDAKSIELDLRQDFDLQKSIFLHRLNVLKVGWGISSEGRGKGTFKEIWALKWKPEMIVDLLDKAVWGNTVEFAANQYLQFLAQESKQLEQLTKLVEISLPAELQAGIEVLMKKMDELAASTTDTSVLMDAFLPLVRVSRYGNVRKTDLETVNFILTSIFYRFIAGLPMSCTGIDEDQALQIVEKIKGIHESIRLLEKEELWKDWATTIQKIISNPHSAALVHGACCKMMFDAKILDEESTAKEFSKALSISQEPSYAANWLEGFLKDAANILILDETIWQIVNSWVANLPEDIFLQLIPLLRRTFASYSAPEKQKIAEKVKHGKSKTFNRQSSQELNHQRAKKVLPLLEKMMGLN